MLTIQKNNNMKKIFIPIILFTVLVNSCSKDIVETNLEFPSLQPQSTDINAGIWKPILLTGPTEFPVAGTYCSYYSGLYCANK
jgi:hypothetical protein